MLAQRLQGMGCEVLEAPALAVNPTQPNRIRSEYLPQAFDIVIFVSRAAWQCYLAGILAKNPEFVWPVNTIVATVGQSTADHARQWLGERVQVISPSATAAQDSESLWLELQSLVGPAVRVLVVRGERGREWLVKRLRSQGTSVQTLSVYHRVPAVWSDKTRETLISWLADGGGVGVWLVTSLEGLQAIDDQIERHQIRDLVPRGVVVVHERLIEPVRQWLLTQSEQGAEVPVSVSLPDDESLQKGLLCLMDAL
jgi:uroporphyrinogen-III synthase